MNRIERHRDFRDSLDVIWNKECQFLDQLFVLGVPLNPCQRMQFHDYVYHHCSSFVHNTSVRAQDPGKHLYENLTSYLTSRLKEMAAEMETISEDEQLLIVYAQKWQPYQKACAELDFVARYFNINWVKRERQEGHSNIYEIYPMAMQRWKEIVFSPIDRSLTEAIARQKKYAATYTTVYVVLQSIVQLYANDVFQQTTVRKKLINVFGSKSGVLEFYTKQTTATFQKILADEKYADLKPFLKYACLAMPEIEEKEEFKDFIKDHISPQLKDAIARPKIGAKDYIQAILGLRHGPLARAIREHKKLLSVIDQVCETAINSQEINQEMTSVERLFRYSHQLMTSKHQSEEELKDELKRIVEVVHFLFDKDLFFAQYRLALQNRQIKETSTSDDMEVTMISQLRNRFGYDATANLYKQLKEMQSSNIIKDQFNSYLGDIKLGFDFRLKCLMKKGITSKINLILPLELQQTVEVFKSFYARTYKDRKVEFNIELSSGEIVININQRSPYFVTVSMFQMALLLQFNQSDKYTVEELAMRLGTEIETIKPVLDSCIKARVLVCGGSLTPSSFVEVAKEFTNRKRRLNINMQHATKQRKVENNDEEIMKKRSFQIKAAVVRIMKKSMILKHSQLIIEVIEELRNQFRPDTKLIKKEIELLIQEEYIARSNDNSYTYLS